MGGVVHIVHLDSDSDSLVSEIHVRVSFNIEIFYEVLPLSLRHSFHCNYDCNLFSFLGGNTMVSRIKQSKVH